MFDIKITLLTILSLWIATCGFFLAAARRRNLPVPVFSPGVVRAGPSRAGTMTDVTAVINEALIHCLRRPYPWNVRVSLALQPNLHARVDPNRLLPILMDACQQAIDASQGDRILLTSARTPNGVQITIIGPACGNPQATLRRASEASALLGGTLDIDTGDKDAGSVPSTTIRLRLPAPLPAPLPGVMTGAMTGADTPAVASAPVIAYTEPIET